MSQSDRPYFHVQLWGGVSEPAACTELSKPTDRPLGLSPSSTPSAGRSPGQRCHPLPLSSSFDAVYRWLSAQPECFMEPDGALLWVEPPDSLPGGQLDGMLYDLAGQLQYVELRGWCQRSTLQRLLDHVAHSPAHAWVQLLPSGDWLPIQSLLERLPIVGVSEREGV